MSAPPTVAWLDGRIVDFAEAVVPIEDRGLQLAESVYEVIPITNGRARLLEPHVTRMRRGATLLEIQEAVPDDIGWDALVGTLLAREQLDEGTLYAQATGGSARRAHVPDTRPTPSFFAYLRALTYPRADRAKQGIRAVTMPDPRWARCDIKTTMLLPAVLGKRAAQARNADEIVLVGPDDLVHEGGSSNVLIVETGRIATPPQSHFVLPGVTRMAVIRAALEAGLEVEECAITRERLLAADEVIACSTSLLAMPVIAVDDSPIAGGQAGAVALELARRLRALLELPVA